MAGAPPIPEIVRQHLDEAIVLRNLRSSLARAPDVSLGALGRFDSRLAAHLDGLAVAGEYASSLCEAALETAGAGAIFTATVCAIRDQQMARIEAVAARIQAGPLQAGMISAFGWLERHELQGVVARLLAAPAPVTRMGALAACATHRVDPGVASGPWLRDTDPLVRARALRLAGELGRVEAASACTAALVDTDPSCSSWAAWSAVLLGKRGRALEALAETGLVDGPERTRAYRLALQAMSPGAAHAVLQRLASDTKELRWLIQGSGIAGDPAYVRWLIGQMRAPETARLAGEAFSLITGVVPGAVGLDAERSEDVPSSPSDNPDDPNVDMDPDDGLPWPDPERIQKWWDANGSRFQQGQRYFMGAPVTREHCIDVLKNGYQRQRILAAHYLCLLEPGTPLFNTSAPAWRQQRLLAQMK